MGAFEDVLIKAKDLAETAGKKTSDMVELTKLKVEAPRPWRGSAG